MGKNGDSSLPPEYSRSRLQANLEVLDRSQRKLVERIHWPVESDHIGFEAGLATYALERAVFPLGFEPGAAAENVEAQLGSGKIGDAFLFGIGLGEQLEHILTRARGTVVAWERDPWLLRLTLMRQDLRPWIRSGKLRFALCTDLLEVAPDPGTVTVYHPFLKQVYAREIHLLEHGADGPRALLYTGGLYVESMDRALRAAGYSVISFDAERLSPEELDLCATRTEAELLVSINYRDGLAEFCHGHGIRLLCWEIDPATVSPAPPSSPTDGAHVFTYRRANVEEFRSAGFSNVEYLPLAADTTLREPLQLDDEERVKYASPVSFVGASVTRNVEAFQALFLRQIQLFRDAHPSALTEGRNALKRILAEQREDGSSWIVPELLESEFPGFAAWCERSETDHDPVYLVGEIAAAERRLTYAARLGSLGLHVWGDGGWKITEAHGVRYRGPAGHLFELNRIYCASQINLDIGRIYQRDIVTLRVFDVMACGGFVLAEHSDDLDQLFDVGREIVTYRTIEEAAEKINHFLAHPDERAEVAARGHRAVLERHTFALRMRHMLDVVRSPSHERQVA